MSAEHERFQIVSATVARMLEAGSREEGFKTIGFQSLIDLCIKGNRLVDIMNSRGKSHNAPIIDSPSHKLLAEALDSLVWFREWRREITEDPECHSDWDFFNKEINADMNLMVLSLVCTCRFYLSKFAEFKPTLVQRRCNQDPCEHGFAHIRGGYGRTQIATPQMACSLF